MNTVKSVSYTHLDPETLIGRYIYIQNDGKQNGSYQIQGAALGNDGQIVLDIGQVSPIRQYKNDNNLNGGFILSLIHI